MEAYIGPITLGMAILLGVLAWLSGYEAGKSDQRRRTSSRPT